MSKPVKILIAGSWESSSQSLPVVDPYSGESAGQTYFADASQIEHALFVSAKW